MKQLLFKYITDHYSQPTHINRTSISQTLKNLEIQTHVFPDDHDTEHLYPDTHDHELLHCIY